MRWGWALRSLRGRDFLTLSTVTPAEFRALVDRAMAHKRGLVAGKPLDGMVVAGIFEKPSTRTRVSMGTACAHLGATFMTLPVEALQVSRGETLRDTATVLSRYVNAVAARVKKHETLEELAKWADVPVINMLSDRYHPLQALADVMTIVERFGDERVKVVFVGDGAANTSHSLMLASALMGYDHAVAAPKGYWPDSSVVSRALEIASETGATVEIYEDPVRAVHGADVIYTDTWVSMGVQDVEERMEVFPPYQVNDELLKHTSERAIVLHCQPWFLGQEITESVAYGPRSAAFDQAENRLHTAKAVLEALLA
ncbi:MAG: ornithine carbamoyltransferase [Candidatus Korarchaeota archaeon]|nr:ornithine carbamoyltransferase [Candidatus Korarchaeota archaeon]